MVGTKIRIVVQRVDFQKVLIMAYKRKRVMSRKPRKGGRRKSYRRRQQRIVSLNRGVVSYAREITGNNLTILSGNNAVFATYTFTLAQALPNYAELTNVFDQYRIVYVIAKFRLIAPPEATNTPALQQFYPDIACAVDHDDSNTATSMTYLYEFGKCKTGILTPNKWFTYKCRPTALSTVYRGVTSAYAVAPWKTWIDAAYTDVPHYALKVGVDASSVGLQTVSWGIQTKFYTKVEFKAAH